MVVWIGVWMNAFVCVQTGYISYRIQDSDIYHSLWAVFHKGLKIECHRTPLIIRFIGIKTNINILAKNLEGGTFVKIIRKGDTRVKCSAITENYISYNFLTYITDISTYGQITL